MYSFKIGNKSWQKFFFLQASLKCNTHGVGERLVQEQKDGEESSIWIYYQCPKSNDEQASIWTFIFFWNKPIKLLPSCNCKCLSNIPYTMQYFDTVSFIKLYTSWFRLLGASGPLAQRCTTPAPWSTTPACPTWPGWTMARGWCWPPAGRWWRERSCATTMGPVGEGGGVSKRGGELWGLSMGSDVIVLPALRRRTTRL